LNSSVADATRCFFVDLPGVENAGLKSTAASAAKRERLSPQRISDDQY
jgi:hypothetical protein